MNAEVKHQKSSIKPKWGRNLPKIFSPVEEEGIAEFLNKLRLAEMKLVFLQRYVMYDLTSLTRWLTAKKYTSFVDGRNKVWVIQRIGVMEIHSKVTLNLFNSIDKNNKNLHITRISTDTWVVENDNIASWLASMEERKLYPNGAAKVVHEHFVKGKHEYSAKSDEYLAAFDRLRYKAKISCDAFSAQFESWKESIGEPNIKLLREISEQYKELKNRKTA